MAFGELVGGVERMLRFVARHGTANSATTTITTSIYEIIS